MSRRSEPVTLRDAFESPEAKRRFVRGLFATIADRYDFITVVLSYGNDRRWKRRLIREAAPRPGERVIDLACGTGDIALAVSASGAMVYGIDVTHRMVEIARAKSMTLRAHGERRPPAYVVGDMTALPLADASVDLVTTGYGLRNVPVLSDAIREAARVLKPGGRLVSLDFNNPQRPVIRAAYLAYLGAVGSILGWLLHRDPDTYRYIPESIRRYPGAEGVAAVLRENGFEAVRITRLLGGLMSLHRARRANVARPSDREHGGTTPGAIVST